MKRRMILGLADEAKFSSIQLNRRFRGKDEFAAKVAAARPYRPSPGRPALPQGCRPDRGSPPNLLIFIYNQLMDLIKSSKILAYPLPRRRLKGCGTGGCMPRYHAVKSSVDLEVLTGRCRRDCERERSKALRYELIYQK
jgi:hypothetical protein